MKYSLLAMAWFLCVGTLFADIHYVDLNGSNLPPYTTSATAANDPADAIDAASSGDIVYIVDGTYDLQAPLNVADLTLQGASTNAVLQVASGRVLSASNCQLTRLTIAGGFFRETSGVGAGAAITNCVVTECVFRNCSVGNFSRTFFRGVGLYAVSSEVERSTFRNNRGTDYPPHGSGVSGGGAYFSACDVRECRFLQNSCDSGSGFLAINGSRIADCLVQGNGGLTHTVALRGSTLTNSVVMRNSWGVSARSQSHVFDCLLRNNSGSIGGFDLNLGVLQGGAGLELLDGSVALRCRITGNRSGFGAGVRFGFSGSGPCKLQNCLIAGNELFGSPYQAGVGSAILFSDDGIVEHCTIVGNVATGSSAIVEMDLDRPPLTGMIFRNNIVWGNEGTSLGAGFPLSAFTANILEGTNVIDNLSRDPMLADDYRLLANSPAIDAGDAGHTAPSPTLFGWPRSLGAGPDIGADEYHPELRMAVDRLDLSSSDRISFHSLPSVAYQLERSPGLSPPHWEPVGVGAMGGPEPMTTLVVPKSESHAFYRLMVVPQ